MSVKRPSSPLSSGSEPVEPLNSKELQKAVKSEQFGADLAALENAVEGQQTAFPLSQKQAETLKNLREIAANADLSTPQQAFAAVRQSAHYLIKSRIQEKFLEQEKVTELLEDLSGFVSNDPYLHRKLKSILERLKENQNHQVKF